MRTEAEIRSALFGWEAAASSNLTYEDVSDMSPEDIAALVDEHRDTVIRARAHVHALRWVLGEE